MKTNKEFFERKILDNDHANMATYLSDCFNDRKNFVFLGFIKIDSDNYKFIGHDFGDGDRYSGICYFHDNKYLDCSEESAGKNKSHPHVIMLVGTDDISYFKRFMSKKDAIIWFNKKNKIVTEDIKSMFSFN